MTERITICPFCSKETIRERYIPPMKRTTHLSDKSSKSIQSTGEQVFILSGCSKCGKTKQEVIYYYKKGEKRTRNEYLERLKKRGLPLQLDSSVGV